MQETILCLLELYIYTTMFQTSPPSRLIFLSSLTHMGSLQIISSQKLHYEKRQQERLLWKCLDWFQKQTKDEDKKPNRRAVLVNTRGKKLALIQLTGQAAIGKSPLIVKLNQELTNCITRLKTSTAPVKLIQKRCCLLVSRWYYFILEASPDQQGVKQVA